MSKMWRELSSFTKYCILGFLACISVIALQMHPAFASTFCSGSSTDLCQHAYAQQGSFQDSGAIIGSQIRLGTSVEALIRPNGDDSTLTTKELWVNTDANAPYSWVEAGAINGLIYQHLNGDSTDGAQQQAGMFVGYGINSGGTLIWHDAPVGIYTGDHTVQISLDYTDASGGHWDTLFDGTVSNVVTVPQNRGVSIQAGIETSSSLNSFVNGNYAYGWYVFTTTHPSWIQVNNPSNSDFNNSFDSRYSSWVNNVPGGSNQVTFYHS